MNEHASILSRLGGLMHPAGEQLRLNRQKFIAVDRHIESEYRATYRPQALYSRADNGFHANNETFLLHEVATNLPIYRPDTGPTDFHLHLPPGGFQLVLVTSGVFTFDYDGQLFYVGPGAAMLQSAIVHRQLFYTWSGLSTEENLKTRQSCVPDALTMGYSGKFIEAFITDPTAFPNPTIVANGDVVEADTSRTACAHPLHNRPEGACFWYQDPLSMAALYKALPADVGIKSDASVYIRDLELDAPSGQLVSGHIIATDPAEQSLLPKCTTAQGDMSAFASGEVAMYRVIRGAATFRDFEGKTYELGTGDVITAGKDSANLVFIGVDTQILRLGLKSGIEKLRKWSPAQRDDIDALGGKMITQRELRPLRTVGKPVGYLYS
jgi:hypothetical protein